MSATAFIRMRQYQEKQKELKEQSNDLINNHEGYHNLNLEKDMPLKKEKIENESIIEPKPKPKRGRGN